MAFHDASRRAYLKLPGAPKTAPSPTACLCVQLRSHRHRPTFATLRTQRPPRRPNAHPGCTPSSIPDPFAPACPKEASLSRSTRSRPCPIQTHTAPTSSKRLRQFFPPLRPNSATSLTLLKHTHIRAIIAHVRNRPRGPDSLPPKQGKAPWHSQRRPSWTPGGGKDPCPNLPRGVTVVGQKLTPGITDSHSTGDYVSEEAHRMSQNLTNPGGGSTDDGGRQAI